MKKFGLLLSVAIVVVLAVLLGFTWSRSQRADNQWNPHVERPAYTTHHPRVVIDEAHHNAHRAKGKYRPFARLLEADGYRVVRGRDKLAPGVLANDDILVIVNAAGGPKPQIFGINLPTPIKTTRDMPAFTPDEIAYLESWVKQGGSLLLVADHLPFGSAARALASAFGVTMHDGFMEDPQMERGPAGSLVFSEENGLLGDHPILAGDHSGTRVRRVLTFTGQSLDGPDSMTILLRIPPSAIESVLIGEQFQEQPAGAAQGLALPHGRGRLVVLGEAAMLTAQRSEGSRFGMNSPDNDNRQFALNVMHWLSRGR